MPKGAVLIVEDSKDVRDVMAEIVSNFGYDVTLANDGLKAWKKISRAPFDLVISDMGLPRMGGVELLRNMRKNDIKTPVILTAGVNIKKDRADWSTLTNYRLLQKPFIIEDIKKKICELLDGECKETKRKKSESKADMIDIYNDMIIGCYRVAKYKFRWREPN